MVELNTSKIQTGTLDTLRGPVDCASNYISEACTGDPFFVVKSLDELEILRNRLLEAYGHDKWNPDLEAKPWDVEINVNPDGGVYGWSFIQRPSTHTLREQYLEAIKKSPYKEPVTVDQLNEAVLLMLKPVIGEELCRLLTEDRGEETGFTAKKIDKSPRFSQFPYPPVDLYDDDGLDLVRDLRVEEIWGNEKEGYGRKYIQTLGNGECQISLTENMRWTTKTQTDGEVCTDADFSDPRWIELHVKFNINKGTYHVSLQTRLPRATENRITPLIPREEALFSRVATPANLRVLTTIKADWWQSVSLDDKNSLPKPYREVEVLGINLPEDEETRKARENYNEFWRGILLPKNPETRRSLGHSLQGRVLDK